MKKNTHNALKRIIIDYQKLNETLLNLLVDRYPYGYEDNDIICFRNREGDLIECVEVRTEDTVYLVKVSKRLQVAMDQHDQEEFSDDDSDDDYEKDIQIDDFTHERDVDADEEY